jgi:3-oxoisoapionate decarboxylase
MRLGISSYTYVWAIGVPGYPPPRPMTADELLSKAIDLHVQVLQIADNLPLGRLSEKELEVLIRRADHAHVQLELGTCGIDPDNLRNYLRLATRLNSSILRTVIDSENGQPTPNEVVATLGPLMPDFERAGVRLALENHDRFRAATLASILNQTGSPNLGICLDTANSIGCLENLETLLRVLGSQVINLHIKDFAIFRPVHLKGFVVEGRPAGQGQLDIPWLLAELKDLGRDVNAFLELWPTPEAELTATIAKEDAWARQSIRYLRQFILE